MTRDEAFEFLDRTARGIAEMFPSLPLPKIIIDAIVTNPISHFKKIRNFRIFLLTNRYLCDIILIGYIGIFAAPSPSFPHALGPIPSLTRLKECCTCLSTSL